MAKISTYADTPPPTLNDFLLGTDVDNDNSTQNFLVSDLINLIGNPYNVLTALVSQSGTSGSSTKSSGAVTKGVTYQITNSGNGNFSNVGAPNNNVGTFFIATVTAVPNSYGSSTLAFNTGAPTLIILENNIGNVWFTFNSNGYYTLNSNGLFTQDETAVFLGQYVDPEVDMRYGVEIQNQSEITIGSATVSGGANNYFIKTPIEIRVYN
jgi:hypothetical protein